MTSFWKPLGGETSWSKAVTCLAVPLVRADFDPAMAEPEIGVGSANHIIVTHRWDMATIISRSSPALATPATVVTREQRKPKFIARHDPDTRHVGF
jgi:hypothetical protein